MIESFNYNGCSIYHTENIDEIYGKKIIDKEYEVIKILKDTKRNYVAVISINNKKYVLKEPRNEYRIFQRKLLSIFKKGEVVSTLINLNKHLKEGITEYAQPYIGVVKRKYGIIAYSAILIEYIDGKSVGDYPDRTESIIYKDRVVEFCKKIHSCGIYHGDVNVWNFILDKDSVKVLDTQGKKMILGKYRAHYDMLNFKIENYNEMVYPYKKDVWYYLAYFEKKYKHLKVIKWFKNKKNNRREKN